MKTKQQLLQIKRVAFEFIVLNSFSQKSTASILGVSERTISKWAIENNWKLATKSGVAYSANGFHKHVLIEDFILDFKKHVLKTHSEFYPEIERLITSYRDRNYST
ncbi:MAG TPA: hypothetical protein VF623_05775 [Segetibacter sp.]|jgi:hypothetical protein